MIDSVTGDGATDGNYSSRSMDCSAILRVETVHVSSTILAAKSPFFYKVRRIHVTLVGFIPCALSSLVSLGNSCSYFQME